MPQSVNQEAGWGKPPSAWLSIARYGLALFFVATALLWSLLLFPFLSNSFIVLFLAGVIASGWFGGGGPGFLAVVISSLAVDYFFFPPIRNFGVSLETVPYFLTFLLSAVAANWLSTARKKADERQRAYLDELFEQAPEAIMLLDLQGRTVRINGEFSRMFGYQREEVVGKPGFDLIVPAELQAQAAASRERLMRGETVNRETTRARKDGSLLTVSELAVPITVGRQRVSDYLIYRDISESKKAAETLQQAQAELAHLSRVTTMGELVASIAHEVNQPIAAVVTNGSAALRWLAMQPPNLDEVRESLSGIVRDANRAGAVIGRIRALLKKNAPRMTPLDLNEMIRGVLALAESELRRGGVVLQTELARDLPPVEGDRVQLQQVILNLVMNSIDAMRTILDRPRELVIKSSNDSAEVLVEIRDNGTGLDAEHSERIFHPFFTTKPQGLGMGLSISRSIIEAHGGRLWNEPVSAPGADFRFTLPRTEGFA